MFGGILIVVAHLTETGGRPACLHELIGLRNFDIDRHAIVSNVTSRVVARLAHARVTVRTQFTRSRS